MQHMLPFNQRILLSPTTGRVIIDLVGCDCYTEHFILNHFLSSRPMRRPPCNLGSLFPIIHCMALKEPAEEYLCSLFEDTCKACYCSTERSSTGSQTMGRVIIVIIDLVSCHCCTGVFYFVSLAIPRPTRRPLCNPGPDSANNHTNH